MVLERFGALPLVSIYPTIARGWQTAVKYGLDRVIASVAIVVLSPLLLIAAADLLASSGWPLPFRQRRVGWTAASSTCSSS